MMRLCNFVALVAILPGIVGQVDPLAPGCAIRCWENTKWVSKCSGDLNCLCSESEYQSSVFQCLYSQCETASFGSALHHVIARCFGSSNEMLYAVPLVPNRDSLLRREAEYAAGAKIYGSGSAAGYPTESANFPTQSVNYPTESAGGPYSPSPTIPYFPLETATLPSLTSTTPTVPLYSALPETSASAPILFTGSSTTPSFSTSFILSFTLLVMILTS